MKKEAIIVVALLAIGLAGAQSVTRTVNTTAVCTGANVEVTLDVVVGSADAYAIDETINNWAVANAGGGSDTHNNHLKWVVIGSSTDPDYDCSELDSCPSTIDDTTYTYVLTAPNSPQSLSISGEYLFDVGTTQTHSDSITVEDCSPQPNDCSEYPTMSSCNGATESCSWCQTDTTCRPSSQVECIDNGCYNSTHMCGACTLTACANDEQCNSTTDICEAIPPACESSWTCSDWSPATCPSSGEQTRLCTDNNNCAVPTDPQPETQSCTPGTCDSDWDCTSWSPAICPSSGAQNRTCSDLNNCPTPTNVQDLTRTCTVGTCESSWDCTNWAPTNCPSSGEQTRSCTDDNACSTPTNEQAESRSCTYTGSSGSSGGTTVIRRRPTSTPENTTTTTTTGRTRSSSSDTTGTRTETGTDTTGTETAAGRSGRSTTTSADDEEDKTPEEVLEDSASTMNYLFYIMLVILVALAGGLYYYVKHRGEAPQLTTNLQKNQQFIQQQKPKL